MGDSDDAVCGSIRKICRPVKIVPSASVKEIASRITWVYAVLAL